eukprot:TRINITY_DN3057_c0_g1_i3.p1 TRINITY_DN3057_c0_g1~~TRINITY_DN3057_c0_g1_i3.p1  ORF type:complete len:988 (-),score=280.04 TRINITY_DN3057_c0_g1_i3:80-3043(-)
MSRRRQQQQQQQAHQNNLNTLRSVFPHVDPSVIQTVYVQCRSNFEATWKALEGMSGSVSQARPQQQKITPQMKLNFFCSMFSALEKQHPSFVKNVLDRYRWDIEKSLDELLVAEEQREKIEKERLRKEAEARRQKEMMQRAAWQRQQEDLQRQNVANNLRSMFPRIPEQYVIQALNQAGWNPQAAAGMLAQMEQQRVQHEIQQQQIHEQQIREAEERRRQEELAAIQTQMKQMDLLTKMDELKNCDDWDQVAKIVEKEGLKATGRLNTSQLTQKQDQIKEEQNQMVDVAKEMFTHLTESEIRSVFTKFNWEMAPALEELEKMSFEKVQGRLEKMFPEVPQEKVREVWEAYFPDDGAAIKDLNPINTLSHTRKIQAGRIADAKADLDAALQRQAIYEKEVAEIMQQRKHRQSEIDAMPEGSEKTFLQTMEEMKRQKEDRMIQENRDRLAKEVATLRQHFEQEQRQMQQLGSEAALENAHKEMRVNHRKKYARPTKEGQMNSFQRYMAEKKSKMDKQRQEMEKTKTSLIAQKMRKQLGEEQFAALQQAIGRAPGGVAAGFRRKDYNKPQQGGAAPQQNSAAAPQQRQNQQPNNAPKRNVRPQSIGQQPAQRAQNPAAVPRQSRPKSHIPRGGIKLFMPPQQAQQPPAQNEQQLAPQQKQPVQKNQRPPVQQTQQPPAQQMQPAQQPSAAGAPVSVPGFWTCLACGWSSAASQSACDKCRQPNQRQQQTGHNPMVASTPIQGYPPQQISSQIGVLQQHPQGGYPPQQVYAQYPAYTGPVGQPPVQPPAQHMQQPPVQQYNAQSYTPYLGGSMAYNPYQQQYQQQQQQQQQQQPRRESQQTLQAISISDDSAKKGKACFKKKRNDKKEAPAKARTDSTSQAVRAIVMKQSATGFWSADDVKNGNLLGALSAKVLEGMPKLETATSKDIETLWVTAVVLAFLEVHHAADKTAFKMVNRKGRKYVAKQKKALQIKPDIDWLAKAKEYVLACKS